MAHEVAEQAPVDYAGMKPFAVRIERLLAEIDEIKERAKDECAPLRDDIKQVLRELQAEGFHKEPFAIFMEMRKDAKRYNERRQALAEIHQPELEGILAAAAMQLELPLGTIATVTPIVGMDGKPKS